MNISAAISDTLPYLVLFSNVVTIVLLTILIFPNSKLSVGIASLKDFRVFFRDGALKYAWIVAATATLGSLFYSEVMGFAPCVLCWYQRIFMYPLSLLLGMAHFKKDTRFANYGLLLTIPGGLLALYHYILQMMPKGSIPTPCSTVGYSVSCTERFTAEFGFVTIPYMSVSAFVLITLLLLLVARQAKTR